MEVLQVVQALSPAIIVIFGAVVGLILWRFNRIEGKIDKHMDDSREVIETVHRLDERSKRFENELERLNKKVFNGKS